KNSNSLLKEITLEPKNNIIYKNKFFKIEYNKANLLSFVPLVYLDKFGNIRCVEFSLESKKEQDLKRIIICEYFRKNYSIASSKIYFERVSASGLEQICGSENSNKWVLYREVIKDLKLMVKSDYKPNTFNCNECNFRGCCKYIKENALNAKGVESISNLKAML
ncbi:MAG: hypothetical protein ACRC37_05375, partial [Lentisphaeria bacterium]